METDNKRRPKRPT
jgi:hypothetical protein